tara:strand:- start:689 stop:2185 length:1497 start_codon:yes stop_codon:yes gene_type:complete
MSDRMANAMALADKCWGKALTVDPGFVRQYFEITERYLLTKPVVNGDEFTKACRLRGLRLSPDLHHNVWVSGVKVLATIGWITQIRKVIPQEAHNHMPVVTQYRSNLYKEIQPVAQHSSLGPSATSRWMNCPGSIDACKDYPRETNEFAAQGTAAHEVAEKCLKSGDDAADWAGRDIKVEGMTFEVDKEMVHGVQMYLDTVRSDAKKMGAKIHAEKRFDISKVHPGIFGTADAVLVNKKFLKVYDLKYGRGVVEVRENSQALTYAVGAILMFDKHKKVEEIEMIIVQPRVTDPVKRWTVTRKYMNEFAKKLRLAAQATEAEDAPRIPGEKQCQWCQHKPHCPEAKALAMEKAMIDFDKDGDMVVPDVEELGDNSIAELMKWLPFLQGYIKSVESRALHLLEAGSKVEGFKLVDKVGRRAWEDEKKAIKGLKKLGLDDDDIYHPQVMLSPSQMGKLLTKELRDEMDGFVVKKVSGVKMVPEDDPAQEVSAGVVSDFADD